MHREEEHVIIFRQAKQAQPVGGSSLEVEGTARLVLNHPFDFGSALCG
jgi:hypothetical protein